MLTGFLGFRQLKIGSIGRRLLRKLKSTNPETRYSACWTEDDGVYFCGHEHTTVAESMRCLVPDGGSFIRAFENGSSRSLRDEEYEEFLARVEHDAVEPEKRGFRHFCLRPDQSALIRVYLR